VGVVLLAVATAGIHIYLFLIEGFLGNGKMLPIYQLLFVGNFFAYVTLATALLLPISLLAQFRPIIRVMLISIAVASIISYFHVNVRDTLGDLDKVIEVLLIVLVTVTAGMSGYGEEFGGRYTRGALGAVLQLVIGILAGIVMFLILRPLLI
ncbi:MAG: hypothetical protein M3518_07435, partial [Actinomycetota bacterium]|nr:hypothetical protein [Actinomycetota bacterium]